MTEATGFPVDHPAGAPDPMARRSLWTALALNLGFVGVEVAGGIVFGSLALLADAAHMVSDVFGLSIALVAQRLTFRPATDRHSFGFRRAEALAPRPTAWFSWPSRCG